MPVLQVWHLSFNNSLFIQENDFSFGIPGDLIKDNSSVKGRRFLFSLLSFDIIIYKKPRNENKFCQLVLSNIGDRKGWTRPIIHLHGNHFLNTLDEFWILW